MVAIVSKILDEGFSAAHQAVAARVANMQPVMQGLGEGVMERIKQRFPASTGPDGSRWAPNARATIEAYLEARGGFGKRGINKKGVELAMSKKPLIGQSHDLERQFHVTADAHSFIVENSMVYAAVQHFGGQAGRGHKVTIPAREFFPFNGNEEIYPSELDYILGALNSYLEMR
ncbi:phage virion morphogenesis protein [Propionivibrio dicarboxylicus]|uniref:Phage virion morphogenesis family protein n=1 Tax=Propionivibrio dicarboxylicus TaxID=83767 RepID=A0A1G8LCW6_9RHOO|nr:phage virion morphogenesis protein [Propionivibrio dicarboxylicus]SDI53511.1 Phage virion morphogenesis family protein [Propionivibrio dicarboxylicus]